MFGTGRLKREIAELQQRVQDQEAAFATERAGLQQALDQARTQVEFDAGLFGNLLLFARSAASSQQSLVHLGNSMKKEAASADSTSVQASENLAAVNTVCGNVRAMASNTQHVGEIVGRLSGEAAKIGSIVGLIREIANQTNLLALNAAIEGRTGLRLRRRGRRSAQARGAHHRCHGRR